MSALNRTTVYGRIVPAIAVAFGIAAWQLGASSPVARVLLVALVLVASLGWMVTSDSARGRDGRERGEEQPVRRDDAAPPAPGTAVGEDPQDVRPGEGGFPRP